MDIDAMHRFARTLSIKELDALSTYAHNGYMMINTSLRDKYRRGIPNYVDIIDSVFERAPLVNDVTVYRGVRRWKHRWRHDNTYISTTLDRTQTASFTSARGRIFELDVAQPTRAIYLPAVLGSRLSSSLADEQELLFPRSCKLHVRRRSHVGSIIDTARTIDRGISMGLHETTIHSLSLAA